MPRVVAPSRTTRRPIGLLCGALLIAASHAIVLQRVLPLVPPANPPTRSPSSDVLLGALPMAHAADRLDALARRLPNAPGVVVADAPVEAVASAYFVIATRLWPRPVSLVACRPVPSVEQFRVPHAMPAPAWRIDVRPGSAAPLADAPADTADAARLCAALTRP